jgi:hypothetical protein
MRYKKYPREVVKAYLVTELYYEGVTSNSKRKRKELFLSHTTHPTLSALANFPFL